MLCNGLKKESNDKSLKEGDKDGNRVGVALVSTVTVDGEVPGMKVEGKQTSPLRWQQHSNWFSFPARTGRKKTITRSPSSPGETVRCCIRKQEAGQNEHPLTNMHTQLAHAHNCSLSHTHTQIHNHMLHFTLQPPLPLLLSHSPAKTSTARENCLETEGKLPPCSDWLSSLATAYTQPASQARCERHTDPMKQIIQRSGQAQWPGNSQEKKSGRSRRERKKVVCDWLTDFLFVLIGLMLPSLQSFIHFSACLSTSYPVSFTLSQFVQHPEWPPCPQGNPLPKVKAKTVLLRWDWFR